jgi:hypothetical protein
MSFGFSVGDFLQVGALAFQVGLPLSIDHPRKPCKAHSAGTLHGLSLTVPILLEYYLTLLQLYQRCRASVTEFKDLSRDVRSMQIVLKAIQEHWEEQIRDGHAVPAKHLASLEELSDSCKEVLIELERLLDKHGELGAGAGFLARMKWVPKNLAPVRMRLLARTHHLSYFNSIMTYVRLAPYV